MSLMDNFRNPRTINWPKINWLLVLALLWAVETWWAATESHKHIHEAIEVCSGKNVFDDDGRRL